MSECIFCKIVKGEISADFVYRDETVFVIRDITPQAPAHFLVIPTQHVASAAEVTDPAVWVAVMKQATEAARFLDLTEGYRMVINTGAQSGQTVPHLHLHLLSGRIFGWPPG